MRQTNRAKVFWSGRSQAVRLPKEFRFDADEVSVRREGKAIILEPVGEWPDGYFEALAADPVDIERPPQGRHEKRVVIK